MGRDRSPESLGDAFGAVARRLRSASMGSLARFEVTPSQMRAVRVLSHSGGVRSSELAQLLNITPRSVTEVVDALEAKGLASREPDPSDRRATLVSLTDRGHELSAEVRRVRGVESEKMFERLSSTDREALTRILRQLQED